MHDEIIKLLRDKNILRQVSSVIQTGNDRDLIIQATAPAAAWISEGQEIDLSDMTFAKKTLKAHKLATAISISNELLQDSFYNLEDFISNEFAEVIGQEEEQAFFNGTGEGQPLGLLPQINADSDTYIQAASVAIAADDLINLETALESSYKQNACWIMHPTTLAAVRKLKDGDQNYIWQQALTAKTPTQLLGYPVYTSSNLPTILDNTGEVVVLFGDFSKFIIGQRGNIVFKPLREIKALQDLSVFLMLERVDCILSDKNAVKGLKLQSF
jgi:HK97 family phage major capsid protein